MAASYLGRGEIEKDGSARANAVGGYKLFDATQESLTFPKVFSPKDVKAG
jgi:hypothetical protein